MKTRCSWAMGSELLKTYHDEEYGFPVFDDNLIFERLMLEIYQAGLSWSMILEKRAAFRQAFHNFDIHLVAAMSDEELQDLLSNPFIIRNRLKIHATRHNARNAERIIAEYGSLHAYLKTLPHAVTSADQLKPCVKQMKADGFSFLGPLILEEFFMSIGMNPVNHESNCFMA